MRTDQQIITAIHKMFKVMSGKTYPVSNFTIEKNEKGTFVVTPTDEMYKAWLDNLDMSKYNIPVTNVGLLLRKFNYNLHDELIKIGKYLGIKVDTKLYKFELWSGY